MYFLDNVINNQFIEYLKPGKGRNKLNVMILQTTILKKATREKSSKKSQKALGIDYISS